MKVLFDTLFSAGVEIEIRREIRRGFDLDLLQFGHDAGFAARRLRHKTLDEPVQIVQRQARLPLESHDWRGLSPAEQREALT